MILYFPPLDHHGFSSLKIKGKIFTIFRRWNGTLTFQGKTLTNYQSLLNGGIKVKV